MTLFIDRDLGKRLGLALRTVHVPVVNHIDRYPSADAESIPDATWIAEAAARGEIILTRDGGIRRRDVELAAIIAANARAFVLETGNASALTYLRAVLIAWPRMQDLIAGEQPPFMFAIRADGRVLRRYPVTESAGS